MAIATVLALLAMPAAPARAEGEPWYFKDYGIADLQKKTRGKGVTVAVIDSGINDDVPNLKGRVKGSKDFSGKGGDGTTPVGGKTSIFHGTAVASVVAGSGANGPLGVAPEADLLSASVWLGKGRPAGSSDTRDQVAEAVRWAVDNDADVINLSLGWNDPQWPESWDEAFAYAYANDVLVIACVGNRGQGATQAWSPSTVPGVLGVGGLNRAGKVSNDDSAPGTAVDLMGPGVDVPVAWYEGGEGTAEGSSFAAPVVAGVAALMMSADPGADADDITARLTETAGKVDGKRGSAKDPDPIVGRGKISPGSALSSRARVEDPVAGDALKDWVGMHRQASPMPTAPIASEAEADAEVTPPVVVERPQLASPASPMGPITMGFLTLAGVILVVWGIVRRQAPRH